jgi:hypothetical protein
MYKYVHVPCLVSALRPIPSRPCNVEAFPIPYLGALVRVAHVGWRLVPSSVSPRARASLSYIITRVAPHCVNTLRILHAAYDATNTTCPLVNTHSVR